MNFSNDLSYPTTLVKPFQTYYQKRLTGKTFF